MGRISKNTRILFMFLCSLFPFVLIGCGSGENSDNQFIIDLSGYQLKYSGTQKLERIGLKNDDLDEVIDLYQEVGDNVGYRDSLLIAEKYNQGLGINAFVQNNLDTLAEQGLTLSDLQKFQIGLNSDDGNAVLAEYKITKGFIEEVPVLYVSQLFIPEGNNIKLISFITEDSFSHSSAVKMFKNILQ